MEKNQEFPRFSMPLRGLLLLAGMTTVAWGAFFKWFGAPLLSWLSMHPEVPVDVSSTIYGSFGLIIGFLIFLSGFYPISWLYLIMVGIGGKLISAIWFAVYYADILGWNKRTIFHLGFNEVLWIIILGIVLWKALQVKAYLQTLED
ncbi:hypothetical protein KZP23_05900 [Echinicola marina]|uniref:hypothetical protein n=1 Tax=Echinicola marina TaxID=2859768 RepID=UPI001CF64770|nr:hypothetical protein [Echinicola marina]UCS94553.1 hypothetical protein KZP23_05900 [Echinicola marina]